ARNTTISCGALSAYITRFPGLAAINLTSLSRNWDRRQRVALVLFDRRSFSGGPGDGDLPRGDQPLAVVDVLEPPAQEELGARSKNCPSTPYGPWSRSSTRKNL